MPYDYRDTDNEYSSDEDSSSGVSHISTDYSTYDNEYQSPEQEQEQEHRKDYYHEKVYKLNALDSLIINNDAEYTMFEETNNINVPHKILETLKYRSPPYIGMVTNPILGIKTFGKLEFTAPEESCVLPSWMMNYMNLESMHSIDFKIIRKVPKGKFVLLEPQEPEFFNTPEDIEEFLTNKLSKFGVLFEGLQFSCTVNTNSYNFIVKQVKGNEIEEIDKDFFDKEHIYTPIMDDIIDISNVDLSVDFNNKFGDIKNYVSSSKNDNDNDTSNYKSPKIKEIDFDNEDEELQRALFRQYSQMNKNKDVVKDKQEVKCKQDKNNEEEMSEMKRARLRWLDKLEAEMRENKDE